MATKDITDLQVCEAVLERHWQIRKYGIQIKLTDHPVQDPDEILVERTKQPWKVCWRALERASNRGYLDYGVSLRTCWLTPKGDALLLEAGKLS